MTGLILRPVARQSLGAPTIVERNNEDKKGHPGLTG
jgi:hypothetical protein